MKTHMMAPMPQERVTSKVRVLHTSADRATWQENKCDMSVKAYICRLFVT